MTQEYNQGHVFGIVDSDCKDQLYHKGICLVNFWSAPAEFQYVINRVLEGLTFNLIYMKTIWYPFISFYKSMWNTCKYSLRNCESWLYTYTMENASGIGQEIINYSSHTYLKPKASTSHTWLGTNSRNNQGRFRWWSCNI